MIKCAAVLAFPVVWPVALPSLAPARETENRVRVLVPSIRDIDTP